MGEGLSSAMRCLFRRIRPSSHSSSNSASTSSSLSGNSAINSKSSSSELQKRSQQQSTSYHQTWTGMHDPHGYGGVGGLSSSNMGGNGGGHMGSSSSKHNQSVVPISICIMILICYVTLGAVLFHKIQPWGVLESLYFCFTSLGTIGFGDLMPIGNIAQYAASAYIVVGMAVVAMCFSLIQTELIVWLKKFATPESIPSSTEDVALVSVAMTPIKSWPRPSDILPNEYNSLPRRSSAFQRNTPARRSTGIMENHVEYFVPRSVSEFNLSGVGDLALPPTKRSMVTHAGSSTMISIPKPREKMVTFEDESKCPHGLPTTPRKSTMANDVFMWREGSWDETIQCPGDIIKVW